MANGPASQGPIVGVVLAAGMSRRLGRPKQLLDLGGKPLIVHVIERATQSALDSVLVVTGHDSARVEGALRGLDVQTVFNPDFPAGQSTSLIAGINTLSSKTDGIVVLLGDQPLVSSEVISRIVERRRQHGNAIVMTGYGGVRSHPVLFGREMFNELCQVRGDQGARNVIRQHSGAVTVIDSEQQTPPDDVDTEEAYARLLAWWEQR